MKSNEQCLKVLIVADNASFMQGGESVLPLHYFLKLSKKGIKPFLLVHERVQNELDGNYSGYSERIIYIKDILLQKILYSTSKYIPRRIYENSFAILLGLLTSLRQRSIIKSMVKRGLVNIVHQPTPVSPKQPSLIFNVGVPVIIGPMNGGMNYPDGFPFIENILVRTFVAIGRKASSIINFIIPGKRKAALLLVSNKRTLNALPSSSTKNVKIMAENGVDLSLWDNDTYESCVPDVPEFIYLGRLVDWKGVNYLLDAFSSYLKNNHGKLTIIGDGPEMHVLKEQAANLNLSAFVDFPGFLPQIECAKKLAKSTALILPSIYECGGAVVLEAMAASKAVIAVDWGGPSDYLDSQCGILIKPLSPEYLVKKLEEAMLLCAQQPEMVKNLGSYGRQKVEKFYDWNKKVDEMIRHYLSVLD